MHLVSVQHAFGYRACWKPKHLKECAISNGWLCQEFMNFVAAHNLPFHVADNFTDCEKKKTLADDKIEEKF